MLQIGNSIARHKSEPSANPRTAGACDLLYQYVCESSRAVACEGCSRRFFQKTLRAAEAEKVQSQRPLGALFAALVNHCMLLS